MWTRFALAWLVAVMSSCGSRLAVIGFIPTEPVSITPTGFQLGAILLNVSDVVDTMILSAPGHTTYAIQDFRHTAEYALSLAFRSTAPIVVYANKDEVYDHELRLLSLSSNYHPLGYYANTEYRDNPLSFGPRISRSTTEYRPFSIDTQYKALLYTSDSLVAVFEGVVSTPGVWDMQMNMKNAMERMAEHLNTDVVQFLLKR